ncbi:MAG TPA: PRC-barrel domain-containing protein [Desulfosporosinus sp.]|nr:PRC-barrel domain-containing protein [Desulfosporosinus sp.]
MLNRAKTLKGYKLHSFEDAIGKAKEYYFDELNRFTSPYLLKPEIGKVKEFYFDDYYWTIRYLVADTGNWLTGKQVLISPYAMVAVNNEEQFIAINLTRKQIENSPSLHSDEPVSKQFEEDYHKYYEFPIYWVGPYMWGSYPYIVRESPNFRESTPDEKAWDPHLRSTHNVSGYNLQAVDGEIGHVEDFIIDDETWAIRYLIIDTKNWWPGKKVLVSPQWIERIGWNESKVFINLLRETIKLSPEYTDDTLLTREYEIELHQYYDRQGYWADEPAPKNTPVD